MFHDDIKDIFLEGADKYGWLDNRYNDREIENSKKIAKKLLLIGVSVEKVADATELPLDTVISIANQLEKIPVTHQRLTGIFFKDNLHNQMIVNDIFDQDHGLEGLSRMELISIERSLVLQGFYIRKGNDEKIYRCPFFIVNTNCRTGDV